MGELPKLIIPDPLPPLRRREPQKQAVGTRPKDPIKKTSSTKSSKSTPKTKRPAETKHPSRQRIEARIDQLWDELEAESVDIDLPEIYRPSQNPNTHLVSLKSMQWALTRLEEMWTRYHDVPLPDLPSTVGESPAKPVQPSPRPEANTKEPSIFKNSYDRRIDQLKIAIDALISHPKAKSSYKEREDIQDDVYKNALRACRLTVRDAYKHFQKLSIINRYERQFKAGYLPLWTKTTEAERRLLDRKQLWHRVAQLNTMIKDIEKLKVKFIHEIDGSEVNRHDIEMRMLRTYINTWEDIWRRDAYVGELPPWPRKLYDENSDPSVEEVYEEDTDTAAFEPENVITSPVLGPPSIPENNLRARIQQLQDYNPLDPSQFATYLTESDPYSLALVAGLLEIPSLESWALARISWHEEQIRINYADANGLVPLWDVTNSAEKRLLDRKQLWERLEQLESAIARADPRITPTTGVASVRELLRVRYSESAVELHTEESLLLEQHVRILETQWEIFQDRLGTIPDSPQKLYAEEDALSAPETIEPLSANPTIFKRRIHQLQTILQAKQIQIPEQSTIPTELPRSISHLVTIVQISIDIAFELNYIADLEALLQNREVPPWPETDAVVRRLLDRNQQWDRVAQLEARVPDTETDSLEVERNRVHKAVDEVLAAEKGALHHHREEMRLVMEHIQWLSKRCVMHGEKLPEMPRKLYEEGAVKTVGSKVLGVVKGYFQ